MPHGTSRRELIDAAPLAALAGITGTAAASPAGDGAATGDFPAHERDIVKEVVGKSHGDYGRVKELVEARPALARVAYDWGYGDWETALGAASHVGRRDGAGVARPVRAPPRRARTPIAPRSPRARCRRGC